MTVSSNPQQFNEVPPVIRIVKKGGHGGHHGGAWKVAYADFVTAMMALFIVLWILGQGEEVRSAVSSYFRNPTGKSLIGAGAGPSGRSSQMSLRDQGGVDPSMVNLNDEALRVLEAEADNLREMIEEQPDLKALSGQISIEVTPEGVRVEVTESEHQPLFETGSARLSPRLVEALRVLGREYQKVPTLVVIEGHTDSAPYREGSGMSNWELSTYRASEARHALESGGLADDRIFMVRGFADRKPRFDDPADPRNRRISMVLLSPEGLRIAMGSNQRSHGTAFPYVSVREGVR